MIEAGPKKKQQIIEALKPMIIEAIEKKMWIYGRHHGIWFSPLQFRDALKSEKFIWGPENWELKDPQKRIDQLTEDIKQAVVSIGLMYEEIGKIAAWTAIAPPETFISSLK